MQFFEREYLNLNYELSELKLEVKKEVKLEVKMEVKKDECIRVKKDEWIRVVDFNLQKYRPWAKRNNFYFNFLRKRITPYFDFILITPET